MRTDGSDETYAYDVLVIATGASSIVPKMDGASLKGVFKLRVPDDAIDMRAYLQETKAEKAVVVGGGFIGLETAENLKAQGLQVTVLDAASQIMPGVLDPENGPLCETSSAEKRNPRDHRGDGWKSCWATAG